MAQPDDHPPAGGLLHHLLTLTMQAWRLFSSADTYCHQQLLLSEVGFPELPGLSSPIQANGSDRTGALSPLECKGTQKKRSKD